MRALTLISVLVVLAGCAQEIVWQKPGSNEQDLAQDSDGCRARAYAVQGGMTGGNAQQTAIVYTSCMEEKGWKRVEAPEKS
jgi:hypothetical protein